MWACKVIEPRCNNNTHNLPSEPYRAKEPLCNARIFPSYRTHDGIGVRRGEQTKPDANDPQENHYVCPRYVNKKEEQQK